MQKKILLSIVCSILLTPYCLNAMEDVDDNPLDEKLFRAVVSKNLKAAKALLNKQANPNAAISRCMSFKGETSLHCACDNGDIAMAQLLIDNNGEVDVQDKNGETPLYQVIAHFRQPFCVPVFATLLRNGADPAKKSPSSPFTGTNLEGVYGAGGDTVLHRLARVIMIARMGGGNLKGTADIHSPEQICTRLEALIKLVVKAKIHAAFDQKQSDAWEQEVAKLFSTQNDIGQEPYRVFPKEKKYAVVANSYNPEFTQEEVYEFRLFKLLHPERAWQYDDHYLNLVDEVKEERKFLDEF